MRLLAAAVVIASLVIATALLLNGRYRVMPSQRDHVLLIDTLTGNTVSCYSWSDSEVAFSVDCDPPE